MSRRSRPSSPDRKARQNDSSYRLLFSHHRMVRELLQRFVGEPWIEQLHWHTLEPVQERYVSDKLIGREDDSVWRVRYGKGPSDWLDIYLLLEFQSRPERFMALRLLVYVGLFYQALIRHKGVARDGLLPPVLPLVLYNGKRPWTAPLDIAELITAVPGFEAYSPRLSYRVIDETRIPVESLDGPVAAAFQLEQSRTPAEIEEVVAQLDRLLDPEEDASLRRAFAVWLQRVLVPHKFADMDRPQIESLEEFRTVLEETVKSWPRQWMAEGFEKGRAKGLQEGLQEGRVKGLQEGHDRGRRKEAQKILLRLMKRKFGPSSPIDRRRIVDASLAELERWTDRLITASSPAEVFDG